MAGSMAIQIWTHPSEPDHLYTYRNTDSGLIITRSEEEIRATPGLLFISLPQHLDTWLSNQSSRLLNPLIGVPVGVAERICGWTDFTS